MPTFTTVEDLKKFYLPSTEGLTNEEDKAWVVMDVAPLKIGDLSAIDRQMVQGEISIAVIISRLREWNYTDAQGNLLPINEENGYLLKMDDFRFLQSKIRDEEEIADVEKKTLSATSSPSVTASSQT